MLDRSKGDMVETAHALLASADAGRGVKVFDRRNREGEERREVRMGAGLRLESLTRGAERPKGLLRGKLRCGEVKGEIGGGGRSKENESSTPSGVELYDGEFDPGSERTPAARFKHASRTVEGLRTFESGERVSNT